MTLHTMTIPDDPADLPGWLERRLVAPDFGRFVAELSAHFPAAPGAGPPRHLLDRWVPVALAEGLGPVPAGLLTQLLKHPAALAAFQERVVADGGAYWDAVLDRSGDESGAFARGRQSLDRLIAADPAPPAGPAGPTASPRRVPRAAPATGPSEVRPRPGGRGAEIWAGASTVVAACLALAVGVLAARGPGDPPVPKAQIAWGWGKPAGLAADESSPKAYLGRLAATAEEWSLHRPSDAAGVGARVAEFRTGCTRLLHSTYGPLAPADRAWLLDRCRALAKALDAHQQALDAGADAPAVRAEVDEAVRAFAAALREKAEQVG